jgi:phosphate starvation-inducible PhoH-like protein
MSKKKSTKSKSSLNTDNFRVELKPNQKQVSNFLKTNEISILKGAPGTGKSFIQLHRAVEGVLAGEFDEIIHIRSAVEIGVGIGFLPGEAEEKLEPYQEAFFDNLKDMVSGPVLTRVKKAIRFEHVGFLRGKSLKRSAVILEEAQNLTLKELISIATRVSDTSKLFINGDALQADIRSSGFLPFIEIVEDIEGVGVMVLGDDYQMRNKMIVHINNKYVEFLNKNK